MSKRRRPFYSLACKPPTLEGYDQCCFQTSDPYQLSVWSPNRSETRRGLTLWHPHKRCGRHLADAGERLPFWPQELKLHLPRWSRLPSVALPCLTMWTQTQLRCDSSVQCMPATCRGTFQYSLFDERDRCHIALLWLQAHRLCDSPVCVFGGCTKHCEGLALCSPVLLQQAKVQVEWWKAVHGYQPSRHKMETQVVW
jgi:hypothetical protein